MKLVIFDLDQTLVDFIKVHDEATHRLFKKLFGVDAWLTEIDFPGRSLDDIFAELARRKGVSDDAWKKHAGMIIKDYDAIFIELMPPDAGNHVLPGVERLLEELAKTPNQVVLYTGDSRAIAECILRATGLGGYFRSAFYGTEVVAREEMVRLAIKATQAHTGKKLSGKDIVIIGDSVRDVEVGKHFGALTIAVATGFHTKADLAKLGPDYVFGSLADYREVLKAVG